MKCLLSHKYFQTNCLSNRNTAVQIFWGLVYPVILTIFAFLSMSDVCRDQRGA